MVAVRPMGSRSTHGRVLRRRRGSIVKLLENGIERDDARNPAVLVDNEGELVRVQP